MTFSVNFTTVVGLLAAFCTTVSYIPQLKKCWDTGSADDLSLKMFSILAAGIALWIVYGIMQGDALIVLANSVSFLFLMGILYFKLLDSFRPGLGAMSLAS
jgi:MtN3 and saliva related transmembrane protein